MLALVAWTFFPLGGLAQHHLGMPNGVNYPRADLSNTYMFIIASFWYCTEWMYAFYVTVLLGIVYVLYQWLEKRQTESHRAALKKYEEEQKQLHFAHQMDLEKKAKEVAQLHNEKLKTEIEHKNAELTSMATNLVQKKELIQKIYDELNKLNSSEKGTIEKSELKKILRSLASDERLDKEWEQFSTHFNSVHSGFLLLLKNTYPDLSTHDLKVCAYLRMNLSSKEMAKLMSISVRGVEISRYRLRKKLELAPKEDLFQFLLNLELSQKDKEA